MTILLEAEKLSCGYGSVAVVRNLDLTVSEGEIVALLGPNGAGKTTTIRTLAGLLPSISGDVRLIGSTTKAPLHRRTRQGMGFVPDNRGIFRELTVAENLKVGRCGRTGALELFPELESLMGRRVGLCSGGEQSMVALGRALARKPRLLLVDEMSVGLAPLVVVRMMQALRQAADGGVGVLLVEQHVRQALTSSDRAYVMSRGEVLVSGTAADVGSRLTDIEAGYLSAAPT